MYTLDDYLNGPHENFELTEEQTEEIRLAFKALKDVCEKHNAPFLATVCTASSEAKYDTRMSTCLPKERTPLEMLVMRHMVNEGLKAGTTLGMDIISLADLYTYPIIPTQH